MREIQVIALTLFFAVAARTPRADVFINEIDYDNAGIDEFEWVELAGRAGASLDEYELVLINQLGQVYNTLDLGLAGFTFADETATGWGFFVLGRVPEDLGITSDYTPSPWGANEIQNGPSDSIQLRLKAGPENVHLIDYEGDNEWTSEDEMTDLRDSNEDVILSLYKTGTGSEFHHFVFAADSGASTPGALNEGQMLDPVVSGQLPVWPPAFTALGSAPNPFRRATRISFSLVRDSFAEIHLYDVGGRRVGTLLGHGASAGRHGVVWSGEDDAGGRVAAGIYFYELVADGRPVARRKILLLR